jgi:acetyltransferase
MDQSEKVLPEPERVSLDDGTEVIIRPISPSDAPYLVSGFKRLSPKSIYYRFLVRKKELTEEEARRFATVDYVTEMAFVATSREGGGDIVVGVARYAVDEDDPHVAEAAILVGDEYQSRGIGKLLMKHLAIYASECGIRYFQGSIKIGNDRIMNFIHKSGLPYTKKMNYDMWDVSVDLSQLSQNT